MTGKLKILRVFCVCLLAAIGYAGAAYSQNMQRPEQFSASAIAKDGKTLITNRFIVRLWGIDVFDEQNPALGLKARAALDNAIGGGTVRCNVLGWSRESPVADCYSESDINLSLMLIRNGLAVTDRDVVIGSRNQRSYLEAERIALENSAGIWREEYQIDTSDARVNQNKAGTEAWITLAAILLGFSALALVNLRGFHRLLKVQSEQAEKFLGREDALREREMFVICSMLQAEISTNKVKTEAFLVIYEELLRNLRDPARREKLKQTGEILHKQPKLSRSVFESNQEKITLLDAELASNITELYAAIDPNPEYKTLSPQNPIDENIHEVETVIDRAVNLIGPMEKILSRLEIILRDKKHPGGGKKTRPNKS